MNLIKLRERNVFFFKERKKLVESIRYVDLLIAEDNWEQKIDNIVEFKVDIFVMGDDWKREFDFISDYWEVYGRDLL